MDRRFTRAARDARDGGPAQWHRATTHRDFGKDANCAFAGMLTQRIERRFTNFALGRVESEVTQRIDYALVVGGAQDGNRFGPQLQIGLVPGHVQNRRRGCLATVMRQQRQRCPFARHSLRRSRLEPVSRDRDAALRIVVEERLEYLDLEFTRILFCLRNAGTDTRSNAAASALLSQLLKFIERLELI